MRANGLVEPFADAETASSKLAGVQAQIVPAAGLSIRARTRGFTHAQLERMLYDDRTLVKLWGQRHTLHLYPTSEWPLVHAAMSVRETWWERQVRQHGGDLDVHRAMVDRIERLLRRRRTLGRSDLRSAKLGVSDEMLSSWGGVFAELVRRGHAVHAKPEGSEGRFAHRTHWARDLAWTPPEAEDANVRLVQRYLHAYGPSSIQDVAYWRGCRVGDAARWVRRLGGSVATVEWRGRDCFVLSDDLEALVAKPPSKDEWPTRMLYRFEPYLLAHREKGWAVPDAHYARVWRPAGHIEGIVLAAGSAVATWRYERDHRGFVIDVRPFARLARNVVRAVETESEDVARYFGVRCTALRIEVG
jgi:hypothetical protein